MSYSIIIGNAVPFHNDDGFGWEVERVECEDAPNLGPEDASGLTNGRHPRYPQMADFCRETGIYELFFDKWDGILSSHPGIVPLKIGHLEGIRYAKNQWIDNHPTAISAHLGGDDWILARLIWYEYWMDWALKNCEHPAIQNY